MTVFERVHRHLRSELDNEAAAGFPRLARVPDTLVRHFLDYYRGLDAEGQAALAEASTLRGAYTLTGSVIRVSNGPADADTTGAPAATHDEPFVPIDVPALLQSNVAWVKWREEMTYGKHRDRYRYTPVPILSAYRAEATMRRKAGKPAPSEWHAMMDEYASSVRGAKAPALRALVRRLVTERLGGHAKKGVGGEWTYDGETRGARVFLAIDYGSRTAQLRYGVRVETEAGKINLSRGFEASLGVGSGDWDFLTEDNAAESIELLGDLIEDVARWPAAVSV